MLVSTALFLLFFLMFYVSRASWLEALQRVESRHQEQNLLRVQGLLADDVNGLVRALADWALWSDTHLYLRGENPGYVESNLSAESIKTLDIDLIILARPNGTLKTALMLNPDKNIVSEMPSSLAERVIKSLLPVTPSTIDGSASGVIILGGKLYYIAAKSVYPNERVPPTSGYLIFARQVDDEAIKRLGRLSGQEVSLQILNAPPASQTLGGRLDVMLVDQDHIRASWIGPALAESGVYQLSITAHRDTRNALAGAELQLLVTGIGVLVVLVVLMILERVIIARIHRISSSVSRISAQARPDERLADDASGDELGRLVVDINGLLERVGHYGEQLRHEAMHDMLTGLPNRNLFLDRLGQAVRRSKRDSDLRFAVLFIDLDHFKLVNDSLGHAAGDHLLREVAARVKRCIRSTDTVARFGGDEFLVLFDPVPSENVLEELVARVSDALRHSMLHHGHAISTSASIGVVYGQSDSVEQILRNADIAMYQAKSAGRGQHVLFRAHMHDVVHERMLLEHDLRHAIKNNELRVWYQPVVSVADGSLTGFECLVRWQHPTKGLIAPDEFIPLAEEHGYIESIDQWVFEESLRQLQQWDKDYPGASALAISVNASSTYIHRADLCEQVRRALAKSQIEPARLRLEITESALFKEPQQVNEVLKRLVELGVKLYLDDFGTGYSSLSRLHELPFSAVKIDRSFVSCLPERSEIVDAITGLTMQLGMQCIAEGVETAVQLKHLQNSCCQWAQGYYFSRPLDAERAGEYIAQCFGNAYTQSQPHPRRESRAAS